MGKRIYTESEIHTRDIDWFCAINGIYVHVASAVVIFRTLSITIACLGQANEQQKRWWILTRMMRYTSMKPS